MEVLPSAFFASPPGIVIVLGTFAGSVLMLIEDGTRELLVGHLPGLLRQDPVSSYFVCDLY